MKNFGGEMVINSIEYDPMQKFITALVFYVKTPTGKVKSELKQDRYSPVKGSSGYITKNDGLGTTADPPAQLAQQLQKDYQEALLLKKEQEPAYFEDKLFQRIGNNKFGLRSSGYVNESLQGNYAATLYQQRGIRKSAKNTLEISDAHKAAEFYLNSSPSGFDEVNAVPFDRFVSIKLIQDQSGQEYIAVYTK